MQRFSARTLLAVASLVPVACGRNDGELFDTGLRDGVASLDHSTRAADAGAAGGAPTALPSGAVAGGRAGETLPAPASGGLATGGAAGAAATGGTATAVEIRDAGRDTHDGHDAHDTNDGTPDEDDAGPCQTGIWYPDRDGDGYGRSSAVFSGCKPVSAPASGGNWVMLGGDCNDDDRTVHPDQASYFGVPYTTSSGESSYDYDCSGEEDGDPSRSVDPGCAALSILTCAGDGYSPTARAGTEQNPYCGSTTKVTCAFTGFACAAMGMVVDPPYGCR